MLDLSALNPQQRQAVETLHGPVLILAGAGTGKTRVITCRVAHLMVRGVPPANILGVTFTNKAAREMQNRVAQLLPRRSSPAGEASRPTLCTFHSLCVRILRQHIEKLGYKRQFVIYDEAEQLAAVKKILSGLSVNGKKADPAAVRTWLSRYKNGGARAAATDETAVLAEHLRRRYESALRACNAVDFDDLILLTLRLFREHPEVLEACRARYRYIMVDEYQDTNAAQFELVHALAKEHRNLCVVGDDDQSIYGWRGAEIANLLDLEKHFPEVKIIKLEQNYRSTTTILRAANAIIQNNIRRRGKTLWSANGRGAKIRLCTFDNEEAEAREVVAQIEFRRIARRIPWRDCAILFRTNQQSRPLETALRAAGVRYRLVGGQSFFDRREIRDFFAYLKTFLNPHDDVSLLRIANVPARGLSDATMEKLLAASHQRKCSVFDALKNPAVTATLASHARHCIESFVAWIERTRRALLTAHDSPPPNGSKNGSSSQTGPALQQWATQFLNEAGYFAELQRWDKDPEVAAVRLRGLQDLILTLDQSPGDSPQEKLHHFLAEMTLDLAPGEEDDPPGEAVTLITMHSCKGLEFPHVFIVGMEDGLLPHARAKTEGTLDEERRLFYVAVTRAMQTLTISHCARRRKYGQWLPGHPSPFLKELPEELIERAEEQSSAPVAPESGRQLFAVMRQAIG